MNFLLEMLRLSVIQIIIVAYAGALFGEMSKGIIANEPVRFIEYLISWISSGFSGVMVGLFLKGLINDISNPYIPLSGAGYAGYAGRKFSSQLMRKALLSLIQQSEKFLNDNKDN